VREVGTSGIFLHKDRALEGLVTGSVAVHQHEQLGWPVWTALFGARGQVGHETPFPGRRIVGEPVQIPAWAFGLLIQEEVSGDRELLHVTDLPTDHRQDEPLLF
jgi:hypothetical protein